MGGSISPLHDGVVVVVVVVVVAVVELDGVVVVVVVIVTVLVVSVFVVAVSVVTVDVFVVAKQLLHITGHPNITARMLHRLTPTCSQAVWSTRPLHLFDLVVVEVEVLVEGSHVAHKTGHAARKSTPTNGFVQMFDVLLPQKLTGSTCPLHVGTVVVVVEVVVVGLHAPHMIGQNSAVRSPTVGSKQAVAPTTAQMAGSGKPLHTSVAACVVVAGGAAVVVGHVSHKAGHNTLTSNTANKNGEAQKACKFAAHTLGSGRPLQVARVVVVIVVVVGMGGMVVVVAVVEVIDVVMQVWHNTLHVVRNCGPKTGS
jgi:hypothetical protein